jgi:hypothetical protein
MGAMIVGDVEFPVDIEHREFEALPLDLDRGADGHGRGVAEFDERSAGRLRRGVRHACSTDRLVPNAAQMVSSKRPPSGMIAQCCDANRMTC